MPRVKLTDAQLAAVEVYVTDPAHVECPEDRAARVIQAALDGKRLDYRPELAELIAERLTEASNSADSELEVLQGEERRMADRMAKSLAALSSRVRREVQRCPVSTT